MVLSPAIFAKEAWEIQYAPFSRVCHSFLLNAHDFILESEVQRQVLFLPRINGKLILPSKFPEF